MKYLKYLFLFSLILSVVSCSDDADDNSEVTAESLVGTWAFTSYEGSTAVNSSFGDIPITSSLDFVGENFDYQITFTETQFTVSGSFDLVINGQVNGIPLDEDTQTVTVEEQSGPYTLTNGMLEFPEISIVNLDMGDLDTFDGLAELGMQATTITFDGNGNLRLESLVDISLEQDGVENMVSSELFTTLVRVE